MTEPVSATTFKTQLAPAVRDQFPPLLMAWYRIHARELPWRGIQNPYRTWVSEIMLQQTRVAAVVDHYQRFLVRFPTLLTLALAPEDEVLALWSGLGYYRRARLLHRTAMFLVQQHGGILPTSAVQLRRLPGVGAYTSAAIASIAFGEQVAVVDGNVERVLLRIIGRPEEQGRKSADLLADIAQSLVPAHEPGDHNQAMMELGATVCLPRAPLCTLCPVCELCATRGEHVTTPRTKMRSELVRYALTRRQTDMGEDAVLLQRRPDDADRMPGMFELPELAPPDTQPQEITPNPNDILSLPPTLRVRHAIVGTNYYVEVFTLPDHNETMRRAAEPHAMAWIRTADLARQPLTGLARKVLQRLRLMQPPIRTNSGNASI